MARVKIKFPDKNPLAILNIPVRISDINYGGHLGNDAVLSIMHEARMQWLATAGLTELETGGHGLIMADSAIAYKAEAFYGDILEIALYADELTARSFNLLYSITTNRSDNKLLIASAKTGMICFDYKSRSITEMSQPLKKLLAGEEF